MPLITSEVAWDILTQTIELLANLSLPLEPAVGAWLAEPVVADRDFPPARRAGGFSDVTRRTMPDNPAATVRAIREAFVDVLIRHGGQLPLVGGGLKR